MGRWLRHPCHPPEPDPGSVSRLQLPTNTDLRGGMAHVIEFLPAPQWSSGLGSWLLVSACPYPSCSGQVGNEPVQGRSPLYLCLFLNIIF